VPPAVHAFLDGLGINRGRYQGLLSQLQQQYTTNPTSTDSSEQRAQSTTASFLGLRRVQQRIRNALFPSTAARSKEESKKGGVANTGESAALRKLKATVRRIEEHDDTKLDEQTLRFVGRFGGHVASPTLTLVRPSLKVFTGATEIELQQRRHQPFAQVPRWYVSAVAFCQHHFAELRC